MLNLWGYGEVWTAIGHHPVAFIVSYVGVNLGVAATVGLLKAIGRGLNAK